MINLLYPWMYFDMGGGGEGGGGDPGGGGEEGGGEEGGGSDSDSVSDSDSAQYAYESGDTTSDEVITIEEEDPRIAPIKTRIIDVSTIPGNKYISSISILSPNKRPLINQTIEGSIPGVGLNATTYIVGTPGAKFYLNVKDIDDDEIFDLSNVEIPASGRYTTSISFPKSTTLNQYKINLRVGDGTRINTSFPTTDPMWTIHQYVDPTITFAKTTGTATGVTYSGSNVTFTTRPKTSLGGKTNPFRSTRLRKGTSISLPSQFNYTVTAAKGGALVYVKSNAIIEFVNNTTTVKSVTEDVVNSDILKLALDDLSDLFVGMQCTLDSYSKIKLYDISDTQLKLSDTENLLVGMLVSSTVDNAEIVSIEDNDIITISNAIYAKNKTTLTFFRKVNTITIKSIDTNLQQVILEDTVDKIYKGTRLSFLNDEMIFVNSPTTSNSGSASTTLTNTIKLEYFGTKDVTYTLTTDDIFTLTPNAFDQHVEVVKETAKDINVLLSDTDDNSGSKTPSTIKNPSHGVISGSFGSGDGTITYTPAIGFVGEDFFRFKVNDGTTDSETKTVFITVKK